MKFPFPALLYAFVCIVVLLVYIHFSTLPGRFNGNVKRNDETTSSDAQSDGKETRSNAFVLKDYMHYTKLLPVLDFRHLGNKRRKVLLLIIISTAPARFQRRQAVRETWWKHCRKKRQVRKQNFDTVVVKSIGSIFSKSQVDTQGLNVQCTVFEGRRLLRSPPNTRIRRFKMLYFRN